MRGRDAPRPSDTAAIVRQGLSGGYRQKMEWDFPSSSRPDSLGGMSSRGTFVRSPNVGDECLSGAKGELARSSKRDG